MASASADCPISVSEKDKSLDCSPISSQGINIAKKKPPPPSAPPPSQKKLPPPSKPPPNASAVAHFRAREALREADAKQITAANSSDNRNDNDFKLTSKDIVSPNPSLSIPTGRIEETEDKVISDSKPLPAVAKPLEGTTQKDKCEINKKIADKPVESVKNNVSEAKALDISFRKGSTMCEEKNLFDTGNDNVKDSVIKNCNISETKSQSKNLDKILPAKAVVETEKLYSKNEEKFEVVDDKNQSRKDSKYNLDQAEISRKTKDKPLKDKVKQNEKDGHISLKSKTQISKKEKLSTNVSLKSNDRGYKIDSQATDDIINIQENKEIKYVIKSNTNGALTSIEQKSPEKTEVISLRKKQAKEQEFIRKEPRSSLSLEKDDLQVEDLDAPAEPKKITLTKSSSFSGENLSPKDANLELEVENQIENKTYAVDSPEKYDTALKEDKEVPKENDYYSADRKTKSKVSKKKKGAEILDPKCVPYLSKDLFNFVQSPFTAGRGNMLKCFIERNQSGQNTISPVYTLLLEISSSSGRPVMFARKMPVNRISTHYVISLNRDDLFQDRKWRSEQYLGKLRSIGGTNEYVLYDTGENPENVLGNISAVDKEAKKEVSQNLPVSKLLRSECAFISFTKSKKEDARTMEIAIPALDATTKNYAEWKPLKLSDSLSNHFTEVKGMGGQNVLLHDRMLCFHKRRTKYDPLSSCIVDFKSRATCVSIKNFQLVHSSPTDTTLDSMYKQYHKEFYYKDDGTVSLPLEHVMLQMGKVGKDCFNMDFQYPLSMFQAFAICLSRFDTKSK